MSIKELFSIKMNLFLIDLIGATISIILILLVYGIIKSIKKMKKRK